MLRDAAQNLLAACRRGNPVELQNELDRAGSACRPTGFDAADEDERRELLAGIVDEMRASLTAPDRTAHAVYEHLLAHLAASQPGISNPQRYLC